MATVAPTACCEGDACKEDNEVSVEPTKEVVEPSTVAEPPVEAPGEPDVAATDAPPTDPISPLRLPPEGLVNSARPRT